MKPSRNDVCPCGSNRKFKKCCIEKFQFNVTRGPAVQAVAPAQAEQNEVVSLYGAGRYVEMETLVRLLLDRHPHSGWAWRAWGVALRAVGKDNLTALQKSAELAPDNAESHNLLSLALHMHGRTDEAITCVQKALLINPHYAEALVNRGSYFIRLGRLEDAEIDLLQAIKLQPGLPEAHLNLGSVYFARRQLMHAEASLRKSLQLKSDNSGAYVNLGAILKDVNRIDEALACLETALRMDPNNAEAYNNLGITLGFIGRRTEGEAAFRKAIRLNQDYADAYSNLLHSLNYHADDAIAEIAETAEQYNQRFCKSHEAQWPAHANRTEPGRRLRIGYVSPDFRNHAVAFFMEPILAAHDAQQVEVYCFAQVNVEDDYTRKFRHLAHHWFSTVGLSDNAVAQLIVDQQIDILVDLAGHTCGNRLQVFARKPAPIQLSYLGYPGTTGVGAIDFRLTDIYTSPPADDAHYSETLLRLAHSLWCYTPTIGMPEPSELPALTNGRVTFGSMNNFNKIDEPTLALWARMLRRIPSARLMMVTVPEGEARDRLIEQFLKLGVTADQLEFHGCFSQTDFHRKFLEIDVSLDPLNVNGATTTCESLWMGVPVISLIGKRYLTRAGFSILSTAGIAEFAAHSVDHYIEIAAGLANDIPTLAQTRAHLRSRLSQSPLTDVATFTRSIERVYQQVWCDWRTLKTK